MVAALREAALWFAAQQSGPLSDAETAALQQWLAADPLHRRVWWEVGQVQARFQALRALTPDLPVGLRAVMAAPASASASRRAVLGALCAVAALVWLPQAIPPAAARVLETGTTRRRWSLVADQQVTLDAGSRLDCLAEGGLRLHTGRCWLQWLAGRDPQAPPPAPLRLYLGTRAFAVQPGEYSLSGPTPEWAIDVATGAARALDDGARLVAGQRWHWSQEGQRVQARAPTHPPEWLGGQLALDGLNLATILPQLAAYLPGHLSWSAAVAPLRASGMLHLDAPDLALRLLAESLDLRLWQPLPGWTHLNLPGALF